MCGCRTSAPHPISGTKSTASHPALTPESEYDGETVDVLVTGHNVEAGIYHFQPDEPCTIMHLLFKMGGLPPYVDTRDVRVFRNKPDGETEEFRIDAREILELGEPEKDFFLNDGDRVVIQPRLLAI